MTTLIIDRTKAAETIAGMLKDEYPFMNWLVQWDEFLISFRIKGNVLVNDIPLNVECHLPIEVYEQGVWLERIASETAFAIAKLLLRKPGK